MTQLLTVEQVAEVTGLKVPTIRKKILLRQLPYAKLGRSVRIPADAVEQMISDSMVPVREK